jgi:hypothetical protein
MQITGHNTREMFDRSNTIYASDAKNAMERFEGYLDRIGSENVTQNVTQEAKKG